MQSFERHQWEDSSWERSSLPLKVNGFQDSPVRDPEKPSQLFVYEDYTITGEYLSKKKSGAADPRFKRVIPAGMSDEIAIEARKVSESFTRAASWREGDKFNSGDAVAYGKSTKIPMFNVKKNFTKQGENQIQMTEKQEKPDEGKVPGYDPEEAPELEKAVQKSANQKMEECYHIPYHGSELRKSESECTLQTKNQSLSEDEHREDHHRLQSFTSTTRLAEINNWMKEFKPENRRSVITVIGQTKGKSFSTVLNEINQRRKLAKELDKHALCETILQTQEREKELKNLIAKVDFVSPDGKIMYTARKIYGFRDSNGLDSLKRSECEDVTSLDASKPGLMSFKMSDEIPEQDRPSIQTRKRRPKRPPKKPDSRDFNLGGMYQVLMSCVQNQTIISVIAIVIAMVLAVIFFLLKEKEVLHYLNLGKPKPRTWYEVFFWSGRMMSPGNGRGRERERERRRNPPHSDCFDPYSSSFDTFSQDTRETLDSIAGHQTTD